MAEDSRARAARLEKEDRFGKTVALQYPIADHEEEGGQWLTFTVYKYTRPSLDKDYKPVPTNETFKLPLPLQLNVGYQVRWGSTELGAFASQTGITAQKIVESITLNSAFESIADNARSIAFGDAGKIGTAIGTDILLNTDFARKIGAASGFARNPFLAATFEGVQFRAFPLNYRFAPKSFKESQQVEKIITLLKKISHPTYETLGFKNSLFTYPDMVLPRFSNPEYLFEFGMCVIQDINVDYHAEQGPIYFQEGDKKLPAFINLSFQLSEIEIVTRDTISSFTDFKNDERRGK